MKIDFELLDELVAAGAPAAAIVAVLKKLYSRGDEKRARDRDWRAKARDKPTIHDDLKRHLATLPVVDYPPKKKKAAAKAPAPPTMNVVELKLGVPKKPKREPKAPRTRIVENWKISHENFDYARRIGLSEYEASHEWGRFYGHYRANGREFVDWDQTWKNWARKAMEMMGRTPRDPTIPPDAPEAPRPISLDQWKRILVVYASTNNWHEAQWGPEPGAKGCRVPPELLLEVEPEFGEMEER